MQFIRAIRINIDGTVQELSLSAQNVNAELRAEIGCKEISPHLYIKRRNIKVYSGSGSKDNFGPGKFAVNQVVTSLAGGTVYGDVVIVGRDVVSGDDFYLDWSFTINNWKKAFSK
jgi:hypothetical protein